MTSLVTAYKRAPSQTHIAKVLTEFLERRKKMSLPLLQTILLGNPNLPTPTRSHKHYMDGRQMSPYGTSGAQANPNSLASRIGVLLKGNKWWLVTELAEHLQASVSTVHSILARHQKKLNIDSNRFYNGKAVVKEYRIKPDGI